MIRINQIKMPLHHDAAALEQKIRKRLGLSGGQELRYRIIRKSIDARKKPELSLVYSVEVSIFISVLYTSAFQVTRHLSR